MDTVYHNASFTIQLQRLMRLLSRRLRFSYAVKGLIRGFTTAVIASTVIAITCRILPLLTSIEIRYIVVCVLMGGILFGTLTGIFWPAPIRYRLRYFDHHLDLADRLTTTYELVRGDITAAPILSQLQIEETLRMAQQTDRIKSIPLKPTNKSMLIAAMFCILLIPLTLASFPHDAFLTRRKVEAQLVTQAAEELNKTLNALAAQIELTPDERLAAIAAIEQALSILEDRETSFDQKQYALTEAEFKLSEIRSLNETDIAQALASLPRFPQNGDLPEASLVERLNTALTDGNLKEAIETLNQIAEAVSENQLSPEEEQALSDILQQLAEALGEQNQNPTSAAGEAVKTISEASRNPDRSSLQDAAEALSTLAQQQVQDSALQAAQAGIQQAQQSLRQTSGQPLQSSEGRSSSQQSSTDSGALQSRNEIEGGTGNGEESDAGEQESQFREDTLRNQEKERLTAIGGEITLPRSSGEGNPTPIDGVSNTSRTPYQNVYIEYARDAEATLSRRTFPPILRDYIRDYFSSLEDN